MPHLPYILPRTFFVTIIPACDYIHNYDQEELANSPTVIRIEEGIKRLRELDPTFNNSLVVLTAGYTKKSPLRATEGGPSDSLAVQASDYIQSKFPNIRIGAEAMGWGTESEIREGIKLAEGQFSAHYANAYDEVTLVISTNPTHLFRLKPLVWMYKPTDWNVIYVNAHHRFSPKLNIREIVGFFFNFAKWACWTIIPKS